MARQRSHAVEVRVLWGADVLRVHVLAPPRTFNIDDIRVVAVEGDRISALAPRGATGSIEIGAARCVPLAGALEEGLAEADSDQPDTLRIPLTAQTKVTIALPARAGAAGYRSAHTDETRVVLEIALVPAERVAHSPMLDGQQAAITTIAAALVLGTLRAQSTMPPPDDEEVSADQQYLMQQYLLAAAEREMEEARPDPSDFDPFAPQNMPNPNTKASGPWDRSWKHERVLDDEEPFEVPPPQGVFAEPPKIGAQPRVDVAIERGLTLLDAARFRRVLRERHGALRACYHMGLSWNPRMEGQVDVDVVAGADGRINARVPWRGKALPPRTAYIESCVNWALDGMLIEPAPPRMDTGRIVVRVRLAPSPALARNTR